MADAPFPPPGLEDEGPLRKPVLGYAHGVGAIGLWSVNAVAAKVVIESGGIAPERLSEVRATGGGSS